MAVYTEVSDEELAAFLAAYDLGQVLACKGIAEGVENSNYFLQTEAGAFILTLYEKRVREADLPFFLGADGPSCGPRPHLPAAGPQPAGQRARAARRAAGRDRHLPRPASRSGARTPAIATPSAARWRGCTRPDADFAMARPNALSLVELAGAVCGRRGRGRHGRGGARRAHPARAFASCDGVWPAGLPGGVIHADLFTDNVFFIGETVSGLIDFYFACTDALAYDLAICLNAWCFEPDGAFNAPRARR